MIKIEMGMSLQAMEKAIKRLPVRERVKLIDHLLKDHDTWREQFRQVMRRIDSRVKKNPISQEEIDQTVKEVRQEIYDKRRR